MSNGCSRYHRCLGEVPASQGAENEEIRLENNRSIC